MVVGTMSVPDETELLDFFESEPVDVCPDDGFWCYEVKDTQGLLLRFSFNTIEGSAQTVVIVNGVTVSSVCHEGATSMRLSSTGDKRLLLVEFKEPTHQTTLKLSWQGGVSCIWSSLRTINL